MLCKFSLEVFGRLHTSSYKFDLLHLDLNVICLWIFCFRKPHCVRWFAESRSLFYAQMQTADIMGYGLIAKATPSLPKAEGLGLQPLKISSPHSSTPTTPKGLAKSGSFKKKSSSESNLNKSSVDRLLHPSLSGRPDIAPYRIVLGHVREKVGCSHSLDIPAKNLPVIKFELNENWARFNYLELNFKVQKYLGNTCLPDQFIRKVLRLV